MYEKNDAQCTDALPDVEHDRMHDAGARTDAAACYPRTDEHANAASDQHAHARHAGTDRCADGDG